MKYINDKLQEIFKVYQDDDKRFGGYSATTFAHHSCEDYNEDRTSWSELRYRADDMYYMLNSIHTIISEMQDYVEDEI